MQVKIPNDFFLNEAKKEYYDYKKRLIIESVSNSLDAGATLIELNFSESGFFIRDNGVGMSRERMIDAMLTMGGSQKAGVEGVKTIGAMGAAKKLILFSHKNYSIYSQDTYASGELLEYNLQDKEYYQGTIITGTYLYPSDFEETAMVNATKSFYNDSYLNVDIFVNGEKLTNRKNLGEYTKEFGTSEKKYGDVYVDKEENKSSYIHVMANGICSFTQYIGCEIDRTTINITAPSKEVFSQSRDSFIGECKDLLGKLATEIAQNNKSWHKKRPPIKILRGHNSHWQNFVEEVLKAIDVQWGDQAFQAFGPVNFEALLDLAEQKGKRAEIEELHNQYKHNVDFYFDAGDSMQDSLPEEFHPKIGLKRNRFLAAIYKACLEDVARVEKRRFTFCIGFTFDSSTKAAYKYQDECNVFFINPNNGDFTEGEMKKRFWHIYSAAIHEFTHLDHSQHDEYYAGALTELTAKCFADTEGYVKIMNKAREYENNL